MNKPSKQPTTIRNDGKSLKLVSSELRRFNQSPFYKGKEQLLCTNTPFLIYSLNTILITAPCSYKLLKQPIQTLYEF